MANLKLTLEPGSDTLEPRDLTVLIFAQTYYNTEEPQLNQIDRLRELAKYLAKMLPGWWEIGQSGSHVWVHRNETRVALIHE